MKLTKIKSWEQFNKYCEHRENLTYNSYMDNIEETELIRKHKKIISMNQITTYESNKMQRVPKRNKF